MVLPLCYCARPHVGAATLNYHRDVKIHQGHICCVSSALRVLHDPCGGVVVLWYSAVFCVLRFKKGFWVCGSGGVFESCAFHLHDGRANRGCQCFGAGGGAGGAVSSSAGRDACCCTGDKLNK